ncbi:MAG: carboxyl transferase domain-containing protein [Desulfobacterales bacterium]
MAAEKIQELMARRSAILAGGGEKAVAKQHDSGKLTARERIALLLDPESFVELDAFVRHRCSEFGMEKTEIPAEGVVTGYGTIDGRTVFVYAQDFTVLGGSLGEMHAKKICKVLDLALKTGAPVVGLNDSGGARIQEGVDALSGYGQIFFRNTRASGVIPQIAAIMGPSAGGAVYSPALMDFTFMVDRTSQMFITGPQVIKAVTGEEVSAEELGGAMTHNRTSGVAHFFARDDRSCLADIRRLLGYLPSNNLESAPRLEPTDDPERRDEGLNTILPASPNRSYDMRKVIRALVDHGEFFEVHQHYAANIIVCFARLNGRSIGIIANQPAHLAGCLDINASDKAARFIRTCDAFGLPLLNLVDVPGFLPGTHQEYGGIIRHGAKMLYAYSEATVPKVTLILRKAYGGAYLAMCSRDLGADIVYAWPTAEIAVMGPEGAANIIFRREIAAAADPEAARNERIAEYRDRFATPYIAAARGYVDDVLEPAASRRALIRAFEALQGKRDVLPPKKHGNLPV